MRKKELEKYKQYIIELLDRVTNLEYMRCIYRVVLELKE